MKQHKWHKEIKAWADGAIIQVNAFDCGWMDIENDVQPEWNEYSQYRIKPQPKEPRYQTIIDAGIEMYNIKKEKLIEKLETDVEFNNKVFAIYNEMYEPPIPEFKGFPCNNTPTGIKEPQYLYVYYDADKTDFEFWDKTLDEPIGNKDYIGKIKLEEDDK